MKLKLEERNHSLMFLFLVEAKAQVVLIALWLKLLIFYQKIKIHYTLFTRQVRNSLKL